MEGIKMVNFEEYDIIINECKNLAIQKNLMYGDESLKLFDGEGIFIRIFDKVARLKNMYEEKHKYKAYTNISDTIDDTLLDLINYAIYLLMIERKKL
jgi:hypothetical protein